MKVVAIANQKGGVGKTTTAISLSAALADLGQRVLMLDLDPQANATSGIGIEPNSEGSMYYPLLGEATLAEKIVETHINNLSLVPSGMDLAGVEIELARSDDHLTRLRSLLDPVKQADLFDFCILDTPPSLGVLMTASLASADEVVIPLQCEWFGLEGLAKIVHVIQQIRESHAAPDLTIEGILMTMFDGRTNLSRQVVEEVSNYFPEQLYKSVIPRTIRIGEAPSHGKTIFEHDPNGIGALAYRTAAKEFLQRRGVKKRSPKAKKKNKLKS
ncbi:ParA family protein [Rubritalea marina]|uniref:ParA family protein n=1 Tax=Rubritalea marina TaxID=361055 RepID=UPI00037F7B5A|nr:ParA family protein [Rubritalea marina]